MKSQKIGETLTSNFEARQKNLWKSPHSVLMLSDCDQTLRAVEACGYSPTAAAVSECQIELEGRRGKMRIHWKGTVAPDLGGLGRAFWESQ